MIHFGFAVVFGFIGLVVAMVIVAHLAAWLWRGRQVAAWFIGLFVVLPRIIDFFI